MVSFCKALKNNICKKIWNVNKSYFALWKVISCDLFEININLPSTGALLQIFNELI